MSQAVQLEFDFTYKQCEYYNSKRTKAELYTYLNDHYKGETDLVLSLMSNKIWDGTIQTYTEMLWANEELWSLNDWSEGEGFGSSDRFHYNKNIDETIRLNRLNQKAESEFVQLHKLIESPSNEDVRAYMKSKGYN